MPEASYVDLSMSSKLRHPVPKTIVLSSEGTSIASTHPAPWYSMPSSPIALLMLSLLAVLSYGLSSITMYKLRPVTTSDLVKYIKTSNNLNKLYEANPKLQFSGQPTE